MPRARDDDTLSERPTLGRTEPEKEKPAGANCAWSEEDAERETLDHPADSGEAGVMTLAGRYNVLRRLGEGGMGSVWLAEDLKLDGRRVAIKMLPAVLAGKKTAYRQVKQEALMAMKLSHPNIATVRAFEEEEGGNPFLVMDYIEGMGLDEILAEKGTLSEEETVKLLAPVAAALDYAHAKGVVHRDVKPGNVMVAKDGTPYVLDFGIAREIQETMTRVTGKFSSGTLLYMSPEQLNGRAPKAAQDVYSFAAMAYECLSGTPPFSRGQIEWQIVNNPPEPLPEDAAGEALRMGVMAGLAKEPEKRPGTCMGVLGRDEAAKREREKREAEEARRKREAETIRAREQARAEEVQRRQREETERLAQERARTEEEERMRVAAALKAEREARNRAEAEAREARRKAQAEELAAQQAQEARGRAAGWAWFLVIVLLVGGLVAYGVWQQEHETSRAQVRRLQQEVETQRNAKQETEATWKAEAEEKAAKEKCVTAAQDEAARLESERVKVEMEKLEETVYRLAAEAKPKVEAVARMGYDRRQGFGDRLDEAKAKLRQSEVAIQGRNFEKAKEWLEESLAVAKWLEENAPLREEAIQAGRVAVAAKKKADAMDGGGLNVPSYQRGNERRTEGARAFENAQFKDATVAWNDAEKAYAAAETEAWSEKIRQGLEAAQGAVSREAWEEVIKAADRVLELDAENVDAHQLKAEAEKQMKPWILLKATLNGREVAAMVTEGMSKGGWTTPVLVSLTNGGSYAFALTYEEEGKKYEGQTTVQAKSRGVTDAIVSLEKMQGEGTAYWKRGPTTRAVFFSGDKRPIEIGRITDADGTPITGIFDSPLPIHLDGTDCMAGVFPANTFLRIGFAPLAEGGDRVEPGGWAFPWSTAAADGHPVWFVLQSPSGGECLGMTTNLLENAAPVAVEVKIAVGDLWRTATLPAGGSVLLCIVTRQGAPLHLNGESAASDPYAHDWTVSGHLVGESHVRFDAVRKAQPGVVLNNPEMMPVDVTIAPVGGGWGSATKVTLQQGETGISIPVPAHKPLVVSYRFHSGFHKSGCREIPSLFYGDRTNLVLRAELKDKP